MHFFKQKNKTEKLVLTCEHCSQRCDKVSERCPNCKQRRSYPEKTSGGLVKVASHVVTRTTSASERTTTENVDLVPSALGADNKSPDTKPLPPLPVAPFKTRVKAAIMDYSLLALLETCTAFPLGLILMHYIAEPGSVPAFVVERKTISTLFICFGGLAAWTIPFMYYAWFESSRWQATPGKRLVGLRVTGLRHIDINFGQALTKSFVQYLSLWIVSIIAWCLVALVLAVSGIRQDVLLLCGWGLLSTLCTGLFMCAPVFRSRTQSVLDCLLGRMVVTEANFDQRNWRNYTSQLPLPKPNRFLQVLGRICYWVVIGLVLSVSETTVWVLSQIYGNWVLIFSIIPIILLIAWNRSAIERRCSLVRTLSGVTLVLILLPGLVIAIPQWILYSMRADTWKALKNPHLADRDLKESERLESDPTPQEVAKIKRLERAK